MERNSSSPRTKEGRGERSLEKAKAQGRHWELKFLLFLDCSSHSAPKQGALSTYRAPAAAEGGRNVCGANPSEIGVRYQDVPVPSLFNLLCWQAGHWASASSHCLSSRGGLAAEFTQIKREAKSAGSTNLITESFIFWSLIICAIKDCVPF